ncbi:ROK family protein [Sciscionella sediminilitoris]|uniref:ROK family protein n=1 Tax=Sciscionella sediminilitoris TaxID=1445613 RepID=UPI0004DF3B80|nr:ROK family protein [Sciscionella sp. SE31]
MTGGLVIGVDVGGTSIKAALFDEAYARTEQCGRPTPVDAGDPAGAVAEEAADVVAALREKADAPVTGIGIALPGVVDEAAGIARFSGNLGWRDAPLHALLEQRIGETVAFGHDVRAGGLAEAVLGAGKGFSTSLFLPIGTGIASALTIDGRTYSSGGYAGELGHLDVGTGKTCVCGATGCLETVATGPAIAAEYERRTGIRAGSEDILGGTDADCAAVRDELLDALTVALAAATTILGPEVIVCGGGVFGAGARLLEPLAARLDERLTFHRRPVLRLATLGASAGCVGAALLARRLSS